MISFRPLHWLPWWLALFVIVHSLFLQEVWKSDDPGTQMCSSWGWDDTSESAMMLLQTKLAMHFHSDTPSSPNHGIYHIVDLMQWVSGWLIPQVSLMQQDQFPFISGEPPFISGVLNPSPKHRIEIVQPANQRYPTFSSWASRVGFIDRYGNFTGLAFCIASICCLASLVLFFAFSALLISCCKSTQIDRTLQVDALVLRGSESEAEPDGQPQITVSLP